MRSNGVVVSGEDKRLSSFTNHFLASNDSPLIKRFLGIGMSSTVRDTKGTPSNDIPSQKVLRHP